jgi:hypothetical protein
MNVTMMNNGRADERFGDSSKTGGKNPKKNARPPRVGVGRVCHLSFLGSAIQPHRAASRPTHSTHRSVSNAEIAGIKKNTLLPHSGFIETI